MLRNKFLLSAVSCGVFAVLLSVPALTPAMASGGEDSKAGPMYVDFKNIVVPIIKANGRTGIVSLNVIAEVKDVDAQNKVTGHMPRYKDAFIRALYGNMDNAYFMKENGSLNIEHIKERLLRSASLISRGEESPIKDILFQQIGQQSY